MSIVFSSCVPCDMLMRTPLAPAAISFSIISGSREAGPSVIRIFAFLKFEPVLMMLISRSLQSSLDSAVEVGARVRAEANEALHELALAIENECLWNRVLALKQKTHEIFVWASERILNAKLFRER